MKTGWTIIAWVQIAILAASCGGRDRDAADTSIETQDPGDGVDQDGETDPPADAADVEEDGPDEEPMLAASRTSGVAPLAVFFDAVEESSGIVQPPEVGGRREYADLRYAWDFGDPGAGSWVGGGSRNSDTGYVAAHVFEEPGTYTVHLAVTEPGGPSHGYVQEITVSDPDTVYSGEATICLSSSGTFEGCPSGALQVTTTDPTDIGSHVAPGMRVLLRRGDTWTTGGSVSIRNVDGPVTIGAFGECTDPDDRSICANAPLIDVSGTVDGAFLSYNLVTDLRIMDLAFTGDQDYWAALSGDTDLVSVLHLRIRTTGFSVPVGAGSWETRGHDQYFVVDSDISGGEINVVYTGSERLALIGNDLRDAQTSHVLRVWQAWKGVIAHNFISGSSIASDSGRHALKMHGPGESTISDPGPLGLDHRTRYVIVARNVFGTSGPWPVAIGPQDGGSDERLDDILVEGNRFLAGFGDPSCCSSAVAVALIIWAQNVTVVNNVFDGTGSASDYTAVTIDQRGIEPASAGIRVLHNTIYKGDDPGGSPTWTVVWIGTASSTTVENNLATFPGSASLIHDEGTGLVEDHNLLTGTPGLVDPDSADPLLRDFHLVSGSPAIDAGAILPSVSVDFDGAPRPQGAASDIGAFEYAGP